MSCSFKPQRAASSIPTRALFFALEVQIGFKPQRAASSIPTFGPTPVPQPFDMFQTPTGRLIHSNQTGEQYRLADIVVSNPNGPPHPFQPPPNPTTQVVCNDGFKPQRAASSIPTTDVCLSSTWWRRARFKPQRAASSIPTYPGRNPGNTATFCFKPQRAASSIPTSLRVLPWPAFPIRVSNPNGPPHPFQRGNDRRSAAVYKSFKPQRAASSIPTDALAS